MNEGLIIFIVFIIVLLALPVFISLKRRSRIHKVVLPENFKELLNDNVVYYRQLSDSERLRFEDKVKEFLSYVRIHAVNTEISELDKLLVASSAVIPAFGFDWHYHNLRDVLIYGDTFSWDFSGTGPERNLSGMVGTGALQRVMILSRDALRLGFKYENSVFNPGIHEFVHLLDKADGETDGIPEQLLSRQYTIPWIKYMSEEIEKIKQGNSDINIYGATSRAEFFAVAAEYFFGAPELFKANHPELFHLMEKVFQQKVKFNAQA